MFWVTRRLGVGPFPLGAAAAQLVSGGVTHVLNVGSGPCAYECSGLEEARWIEVVDLRPIPLAVARACLEALHAMATRPGPAPARVYVHCAAGQNRSPTVLWLYLIACGLEPEAAGERIGAASFDAVPGHPLLVGPGLVEDARAFGRERIGAALPDELLAPPLRRSIG